jgi:flagellar basal body rod protein FlgG
MEIKIAQKTNSSTLLHREDSEMADTMAQISSSVTALTQEFDIIAHNLANVSTVGYKRRCNAFTTSLDSQQTGAATDSGGTVALNTALDFSQGNLVETGRPLDFALYGGGFFVIETPQGPLYTRNGVFCTNQNGQIVDSQGRTVAGEAGPITMPGNVGLSEVTISSEGEIAAGGTDIGKFRLVDFKDDESKLLPTGGNCYRMPDADIRPVPAEHIIVKQGYQEASNVKLIDELVDMILVARLYEANMKIVTAQKEASGSMMSVAMSV